MSTTRFKLPLEIASVSDFNLLPALESVRGCLKTTSMLWMHALGLPVLPGVVVSDWSKASAIAVNRFCRRGQFSNLLLRIDKRNERWTRRRGGYLLGLRDMPALVKELQREGMIAALLEPASPYADQYSLAGVTDPEREKMIVEVVGHGFDASDILRGDLPAHERWEIDYALTMPRYRPSGPVTCRRLYLATPEQYSESVRKRLAKNWGKGDRCSISRHYAQKWHRELIRTDTERHRVPQKNEASQPFKKCRRLHPNPEKHVVRFRDSWRPLFGSPRMALTWVQAASQQASYLNAA